jgi:CRISPR-associated protein Cmr2
VAAEDRLCRSPGFHLSGSRLISDLSRHLATRAQDQGADLVLPVTGSPAFPHQLVLRVEADRAGACSLGEALKEEAIALWRENAHSDGLAQLDGIGLVDGCLSVIEQQLDETFELYWVAVPLERDFATAYRALGELYDARRRTRTFCQASTPAFDPWACSQCGVRAAVQQPGSGLRAALVAASRWRLQTRDRLCGVCLAKRWWAFDHSARLTLDGQAMPSTVRLARDRFFRDPVFAPLRTELSGLGLSGDDQVALLDEWDELCEAASSSDVDGSTRSDSSDRNRRLLKGFRSLCGTQPGRDTAAGLRAFAQLSPYYSVALFDGDEMGKWFAGDQVAPSASEPRTDLEQVQCSLGRCLAAFAGALQRVVQHCRGTLVYAGGDDGMALLPLDSSLDFASRLHTLWQDKVQAPIAKLYARQIAAPPSISLHLSVIHENEPLQPAVRRLHLLLEETKERAGRAAFSVLAEPRSGSSALLVAKWCELECLINAVESLSSWSGTSPTVRPSQEELAASRAAQLPGRLPYLLSEGLEPFVAAAAGLNDRRVLYLELRRALRRAARSDHALARGNDLITWLSDRVEGRTPCGDFPRSPAVGAAIGGARAASDALEVTAFLARWLDWKESQ